MTRAVAACVTMMMAASAACSRPNTTRDDAAASGQAGFGGTSNGGGATGSAGTSDARSGTGGTSDTDGSGGTGGSSGTGGTAGAGGTAAIGGAAGAAGASSEPLDVTTALDGQQYLMPCTGKDFAYTLLECENYPRGISASACTPSPNPPLTQGRVMRDDTLTVGGPPGAVYDVTLRVRGVVEPKHYIKGASGSPANGTNYGWYTGGEPATPASYGVYMLWVSSPVVMQSGTLDGQYYFLNAIDHNEAHFSYPIDYTVTLPIAAGAQVRFLAADPNCIMVKNCDSTSIDGASPTNVKCNPSTIADLPASAAILQPYNGQFIYLTVVSAVMR